MYFRNSFAHVILLSCVAFLTLPAVAAPTITGTPVTDAPPILKWEFDQGSQTPSLHDEVSNVLWDFHGNLNSCDLMLSTEGNYHMALRDIWPDFLAKFKDQPLVNAFYTTSPPVVVAQIANSVVQFGNLYAKCSPSVAVANKTVIDKLVAMGVTDGTVYPLYKDRGLVILVKRGNPKDIKSVWDLGRANVNLVTPNFKMETGAFQNYSDSIYNIAQNDPYTPFTQNADSLFNTLFNGSSGNSHKWLQGARIHHRDEPWSVAYGKADAAVIYYHLGLFAKQTFPDTFDLVPLGGTLDNPRPLAGTVTTERYVVALKGNWNRRQLEARHVLIKTLLSEQFTHVLEKRGLQRPDDFIPAEYPAQVKLSSR